MSDILKLLEGCNKHVNGDCQTLYCKQPDGSFSCEVLRVSAQLAEALKWKKVITDAAVVSWTLTAENEHDPVKAVNALLCDAQRIALDPQVSSEAAKLRDTYKAELAEAERKYENAMAGMERIVLRLRNTIAARDATIRALRGDIDHILRMTHHNGARGDYDRPRD